MGVALLTLALAASPGSVYRVSPEADGAVIVTASLAIALPYFFANGLIHPSCPCARSSVPGFDRISLRFDMTWADDLSTAEVGLTLVGPAIADGLSRGLHRAWLEDAAVEAETVLVAGALVTASKYTVQRPIPAVVSGKAPELVDQPGGYRSFFSGHTVVAVAALTAWAETWTLRHGKSAWPWVLTGVVSGSVMVERILAGRHFPSDVVVGAAVGLLVGTAVPALHSRKRRLGIALTPARGGAGVALEGVF